MAILNKLAENSLTDSAPDNIQEYFSEFPGGKGQNDSGDPKLLWMDSSAYKEPAIRSKLCLSLKLGLQASSWGFW